MTPEELEAAIRNNSAEKLTAMLLPLTEPERKKLAKAAVRIKRVAKEELTAVYQPLRVYSSANQDLCKASGFQARVELAILALCPWTEARKVTSRIFGWGVSTDYGPLIYQILKARKPDWLERWATKELEGRTEPGDWGLIRQLIRDGLCSKPTSQQYIIKMVHGLPGYRWRERVSLVDHLRADPGLLEDEVWRIFEVDPLNETLLPDMGAGQDAWSKALAELVKEGRLDRCRMLKASLEALTRGLQPKNTGWFWKFHECLQPTVEEG